MDYNEKEDRARKALPHEDFIYWLFVYGQTAEEASEILDTPLTD